MKAYRIRANGRDVYRIKKGRKVLRVFAYSFIAGFLLAYILLHIFLFG